jgi:hypothetical protein
MRIKLNAIRLSNYSFVYTPSLKERIIQFSRTYRTIYLLCKISVLGYISNASKYKSPVYVMLYSFHSISWKVNISEIQVGRFTQVVLHEVLK